MREADELLKEDQDSDRSGNLPWQTDDPRNALSPLLILELLSSGMSNDEIIADYPDLEPDDIRAVFAYALRLSQVKRMDSVDR